MRLGEHVLLFGPQADQLVDVEEAPISEVTGGSAPQRQAVVLCLEQRVEPVDIGVHRGDRRVERAADARFRGQLREAAGKNLGIALPAGDELRVRRRGGRQLGEGGADKGQLVRADPLGGIGHQAAHRLGVERKSTLGVLDDDPAIPPRQPNLAGLEHPAVVIGQDRQQDHVAQPALRRVPVDVEETGVAAGQAVLEHIGPPAVLLAGDRHVVRHDVEDQAHPPLAQRIGQALEALGAAELVVDPAVVDHVVAVRRAGRRLEDRRDIEVADPQLVEVRHDRGGVGKREAGVQLDAVGRARRRSRLRSKRFHGPLLRTERTGLIPPRCDALSAGGAGRPRSAPRRGRWNRRRTRRGPRRRWRAPCRRRAPSAWPPRGRAG